MPHVLTPSANKDARFEVPREAGVRDDVLPIFDGTGALEY